MTLKNLLDDPTSPLRLALKEHLPRLAPTMRATWKPAMTGREVLAAPDGAPADVLGHAIHERLVWTRAPLVTAEESLKGAYQLLQNDASPALLEELHDLARRPAADNSPDTAGAAALIGMMDQVYRYPLALAEPIYQTVFTARGLDEAIAGLPQPWVADITAVTAASGPLLADLTGPATPGATFTGSSAVGGADADLIVGTTLVEIKAVRTTDLRLRDAQQLIVYALLDVDDQYALTHAALLSARYAQVVTWDLGELLDRAGQTTLQQARASLELALT